MNILSVLHVTIIFLQFALSFSLGQPPRSSRSIIWIENEDVPTDFQNTKEFNIKNPGTDGEIESSNILRTPEFTEFIKATKLGGKHSTWKGKSLISVEQLDRDGIELALRVAESMQKLVAKKGGDQRLKGKVLGCFFYEPSTRTSASFQAAMQKLGGSTIHISQSCSSVQKGESLSDTIRCLSTYCDLVALRHPQLGSSFEAATAISKPVFNAGDGPGEHPTQALLDLLTIKCELGAIDGKVITILGDLRNGRTVHSLVRMLKHFEGVSLHYVSPENLQLPIQIKEELATSGISQKEHINFDEILPNTDVLYVTRVQKERFSNLKEYEECKNAYVIDKEVLQQAKKNMIIMHPLPRVNEISANVDNDTRAAYFRQMEYGMFMRMGLLCLVFGAI